MQKLLKYLNRECVEYHHPANCYMYNTYEHCHNLIIVCIYIMYITSEYYHPCIVSLFENIYHLSCCHWLFKSHQIGNSSLKPLVDWRAKKTRNLFHHRLTTTWHKPILTTPAAYLRKVTKIQICCTKVERVSAPCKLPTQDGFNSMGDIHKVASLAKYSISIEELTTTARVLSQSFVMLRKNSLLDKFPEHQIRIVDLGNLLADVDCGSPADETDHLTDWNSLVKSKAEKISRTFLGCIEQFSVELWLGMAETMFSPRRVCI